MTLGATGVKIYQNMKYAQIINSVLSVNYSPFRWLEWNHYVAYSYGRESTGAHLPLIAPLTYQSNLRLYWKNLEINSGVRTATHNTHCGTKYGETSTPGYAIWHLSIGSCLQIGHAATDLHLGVENIFDKYYSTYADWCHIPQKGRNIYMNLSFKL